MGEFPAFPKVPRLHREVVITEKIDGTNGLVAVYPPDASSEGFPNVERFRVLPDGTCLLAGSRNRWIHPKDDNFGFAAWVWEHAQELSKLGPGVHHGEWWGSGIQRGYGLPRGEKRWSLFNVAKWSDDAKRPECCDVVPTLREGNGDELTPLVRLALDDLHRIGSFASPGFINPEGVVIYHTAANSLFKVTLEGDSEHKSVESFVQRVRAHQGKIDRGLVAI
jgi:hypothetical protein